MLSKSYVSALPDTEKKALSADVRRILSDAEHELDWLDKAAGVWNYPYQTGMCYTHDRPVPLSPHLGMHRTIKKGRNILVSRTTHFALVALH